jgi:ribosomal-protein-alanine N-acetyltransferase
MNKFPQIHSPRLLLRQITQEDITHIFKGLSHIDVIKHYGINFKTLEATQEQMDWFADLELNKKGLWWAICSSDNTKFYGAGGFCDWNHEEQKAEVGFWLLPDSWSKGFMSEAMPLICNYALEYMNIKRIEGFVETDNFNCKKAIDKLGFTLEKTMKDCEDKNGKLISVDVYVRTDIYLFTIPATNILPSK